MKKINPVKYYDDDIQRDSHDTYGGQEEREYEHFTAGINLKLWSLVLIGICLVLKYWPTLLSVLRNLF
jgi:hypothetical protein